MPRLTPEDRAYDHLAFLYGESVAQNVMPRLQAILEKFKGLNLSLKQSVISCKNQLSHQDVILIAYGDQIYQSGHPPLQTLTHFLEQYLKDAINIVHILPFFPYSTDDGFSVIDYRQVNPELGSWEDIDRLSMSFRLMFDAVINHVSRRSKWFEGFLNGNQEYQDYFITINPDTDLSMVVRPRTLPLLTRVEITKGIKYVWTTFSEDQIDLNYANPEVLLEIIDLLLFYVAHGAEFIRLDAIAYLWKEPGTQCIHLPQTHQVVKLFRAILDAVAPGVILITETNVPHEENISYFGSPLPSEDSSSTRGDEAQMVYQFPLAPLVLHTFYSGDSRILTRWAASLEVPHPTVTFLNFIASHDGIGVRPAEGLLSTQEIQVLVEQTLAHGGKVSYKTNPDGTKSAYELNISLYDALNDPENPQLERDVSRFLASQAIMLSLSGVPGIYFHSLFGSPNCHDCVAQTGMARSINRQKLRLTELEGELANPNSRAARVFSGYINMLRSRRKHPAFHPHGFQQVLELGREVFAVWRSAPNENDSVLCLVNVTPENQAIDLEERLLGIQKVSAFTDLLSGKTIHFSHKLSEISLEPYRYLWLSPIPT